MRIWSRLMAIVVLSIPLTRWMIASEQTRMSQYRTLGRDALLAALDKHYTRGPLVYLSAILALAICFFAIHGVAVLIERVTGAPRADRRG